MSLTPAYPLYTSILHIAVTTNDIFTREDQEFLIKNGALPAERIKAIETGGCPHAAIREDISANLGALEELQAKFGCDLLFLWRVGAITLRVCNIGIICTVLLEAFGLD